MSRPKLLDLFCGAGGAAVGYYRAGFDVVGVDILPQPRYPFEFHQADAMAFPLDGFDAIHASPPCQAYSRTHGQGHGDHPRLIGDVRERLQRSAVPWIIENVPMTGKARGQLPAAIVLCGTMFGLRVLRHRWFESSHLLLAPPHPRHGNRLPPGFACVYGHTVHGSQTGRIGNVYTRYNVAYGRVCMGIDWPMTQAEVAQAIPPAYTEWLGHQIMAAIRNGHAA